MPCAGPLAVTPETGLDPGESRFRRPEGPLLTSIAAETGRFGGGGGTEGVMSMSTIIDVVMIELFDGRCGLGELNHCCSLRVGG